MLWVDKGLMVRAETLQEVRRKYPQTVLVSYSPDDMMNPDNQSSTYIACIPEYDVHVTTKSFNVAELLGAGAQNAIMVDNGYSENVHRPVFLSREERVRLGGPVGCVAFWERDRERSVTHLAANKISVRVWGPWPRKKYHANLRVEGIRAWAEDYARVICAFDINLGFLRKANRDQQTTRSVEIPACGAFMLAERSEEHLRLFEEGKEAEFFDTDDELLDKVRYYLAHATARERIAGAGRDRCLRSGYGNRCRMREVLNHVWSLVSV
jgi:spore maturation protein CgeB